MYDTKCSIKVIQSITSSSLISIESSSCDTDNLRIASGTGIDIALPALLGKFMQTLGFRKLSEQTKNSYGVVLVIVCFQTYEEQVQNDR